MLNETIIKAGEWINSTDTEDDDVILSLVEEGIRVMKVSTIYMERLNMFLSGEETVEEFKHNLAQDLQEYF